LCIVCAFAVPAPPSDLAVDRIFPTEASALPWPEGAPIGGSLVWTGVAGFVFEVAGTRIAFDPFVSRPGLFATLARRARSDDAAVVTSFSGLDAVFVGHTHYDHAMDVPSIAAASPHATINGSRVTTEMMRRLGVGAGRCCTVEDGRVVEVGPFRVEPIASAHGHVPIVHWIDRVELPREGVPRTPFRWPRGDVFAWRVEVGGRSFHLQGSAGLTEAPLARQRPCDVLVACLAARRGTPDYLARLGATLRPALLLPCHHDDFFRPLSEPAAPIATLRWGAFREEAAALATAHGTRLVLPPRMRPLAI